MATKNYSAMSTKKLQALLENASEEEQVLIQQELSAREPQPYVPEDGNYADALVEPLTEEEERVLQEAEANGGINAMYEKAKAVKPTPEELEALKKECEANVGHRCNVVPFNTIEWLQGYIAGVTTDKRAGKVLYTIKLDNGKRIVKAYNSSYLNILDEVVDMTVIRSNARRAAAQVERVALTEEERALLMAKERLNIGKRINIQIGIETDEATGEQLASYVEGRVTAISLDKRTDKVIYKVQIPNVDGTSRNVFRTNNNEGYELIDELDALGVEMQDAAQKRFNHEPKAKAAIKALTREDLTRKIEQAKKLIESYTNKLKAYEEQLQALGGEQDTAKSDESEELI